MSYEKPLKEREKALEDAWFREENERLIESLRAKQQTAKDLEALARAVGLRADADSDRALLQALLDAGVKAETVPALALLPLVSVAWASGNVTEAEAETVLAAAREGGVEPDSEADRLLESWLSHRPRTSLVAVWRDYLHAVSDHVDGVQRGALKSYVLGLATRVARASGGIARMGAISIEEQAVIDEIEAAFD